MSAAGPNARLWVGRPIRRFEDAALLRGHGRFTADLAAALWVRFMRSPVAAGRIVRITAPADAMVVTAADLAGVQPVRPMLQRILAALRAAATQER